MTSSSVAATMPSSTERTARAWTWVAALLLLGIGFIPAAAKGSALLAPAPAWPIAKISSVSIPLDDECPESQASNGAVLSAGLGPNLSSTTVVDFGVEETFGGDLVDVGGRGIPNAFICIYSAVVTDQTSKLLGVAVTDSDGRWQFRLPGGPSRNLTAVYRSDQGQVTAWALLQVRAAVSLRFAKETVDNKHFAHFSGRIPGPHNDRVTVVLQVQIGKNWLVFRRYSTRGGGKYAVKYRFTRTHQPTRYTFRAQVPGAPGYPYLPGSSEPKDLIVLP